MHIFRLIAWPMVLDMSSRHAHMCWKLLDLGTKLYLDSRLCFEIRLISWFYRFFLWTSPLSQLIVQLTLVQKVHGSIVAQDVVSFVNYPEKWIRKKQHEHLKGIFNQYMYHGLKLWCFGNTHVRRILHPIFYDDIACIANEGRHIIILI